MKFHFIACLLLGLISLTSCSEMEDRQQFIGYDGRARKNPYLAAERYLESDGHVVTSTTGVLKFDGDEGVVFSPATSVRSIGDAERVIDWVYDGGHYLCFLERGEDYWKDVGDWAHHDPEDWREDTEGEAGLNLLLESVYLSLVDDVKEQYKWEARGGAVAKGKELPFTESVLVMTDDDDVEFAMELGGTRLLVAADDDYYVDDWYDEGEEHHFFSRTLGEGRITFISDARAFRNPYLQIAEHAEALDYIAGRGGKIVFSLGKVRSFTSMLGEYLWKAVWALFVLTVLWIWKSLPRFGPLLEASGGDDRNYAKQLKRTGQFLWRHKREDALLKSLRDAVVKKSGHLYEHGADSSDLIDSLVQSSGLELKLVTEAMTRTQVRDASTMVKITKTLQQILKSL
ncbi:MAG: DUF4350 domain-containing protein, partial [Rubritalea sp.]|uniref:DUF4350 domain-containing protein n=1 Tax=Rubritalea sp. TaxID=2109375 RepID=UPI003241F213